MYVNLGLFLGVFKVSLVFIYIIYYHQNHSPRYILSNDFTKLVFVLWLCYKRTLYRIFSSSRESFRDPPGIWLLKVYKKIIRMTPLTSFCCLFYWLWTNFTHSSSVFIVELWTSKYQLWRLFSRASANNSLWKALWQLLGRSDCFVILRDGFYYFDVF